MTILYDNIGRAYSSRRQRDPSIGTAIEDVLAGCKTILNVGAGTGSYEPQSQVVIAVEPSRTMIAQRPVGAAPVVQAYAEALPFQTGSFDAVLGILTVHHWKDQAQGLAECSRAARSRVVFLTNDFDVCEIFWLFDYVPELLRVDRRIFPPITRFEDAFGVGRNDSRPRSCGLSRRITRRLLETTACLFGPNRSNQHLNVFQNRQYRRGARSPAARYRLRCVSEAIRPSARSH